jgi:hypothetical protein
LCGELDAGSNAPIGLFALTADAPFEGDPVPDVPTLLRRVDDLHRLGHAVLLLRYRELYRMTAFVNRFTDAAVRFAIGVPTLVRVFEQPHYHNLPGRILEGLARLFAQNVQLHVYPTTVAALEERGQPLPSDTWVFNETGGWVTADRLRPIPPLDHIYDYLLATGFIVATPPPAS